MPAPFRGTYRQISDRGEHSTPVMFFTQHQVADTGSTTAAGGGKKHQKKTGSFTLMVRVTRPEPVP